MPPLLVIAALAAAPVPNHTLTVLNDTGTPVNQLFVSAKPTKGWRAKVAGIVGPADAERDRLDAGMLARGGSVEVALAGERCRYDLRAVLEDGRTFTATDFDVCRSPRWAIASGTRR